MTFAEIEKIYNSIKDKVPFTPHIAVVLGSGLGEFAESLEIIDEISYSDIKGFPKSTVHGHKGRFVFAKIDNVKIVLMQGRVHYYEGYTMAQVVLPIRIMRLMGAEKLLLTNAAGGINQSFPTGSFMAINDHINFAQNPLIGTNISEFGTRFPDMTEGYDKKLIKALHSAADEEKIKLYDGVYAQLTGPSFETPAEIKMLRIMGADAVGMSTACEAIAANHAGMRVAGVSCISNAAAGLGNSKLSHEDVNITMEKSKDKLTAFLKAAILKISEERE